MEMHFFFVLGGGYPLRRAHFLIPASLTLRFAWATPPCAPPPPPRLEPAPRFWRGRLLGFGWATPPPPLLSPWRRGRRRRGADAAPRDRDGLHGEARRGLTPGRRGRLARTSPKPCRANCVAAPAAPLCRPVPSRSSSPAWARAGVSAGAPRDERRRRGRRPAETAPPGPARRAPALYGRDGPDGRPAWSAGSC